MVAEPAETPVTTPVLLTLAIPVLLLTQVPPTAPIVSFTFIVPPLQVDEAPVSVPETGEAITVIGQVEVSDPQLLVVV